MTRLRRLLNNLRALNQRARVDADLDRELGEYLDAAMHAKMAAGMDREDAVRAARAEMGSAAALKDYVADAGWERWRDRLSRDLRHAGRGIRARGWRGALVIALLGVTLAANTLVFSATDAFVLQRVPYPKASRLVQIGEQGTFGWNGAVLPETAPIWRGFTDLFSAFHVYLEMGGRAYVAGGPMPRFVQAARVSPGLLEDLGARPVAGRLFLAGDARAGAEPVAIVAEELARQEFGDSRLALGKTVEMGDERPRVVGVLPVAFRFPSGRERVWIPLDLSALQANHLVSTLARMAPGQPLESVSSAVVNRAPAVLTRSSPPWNRMKPSEQVRMFGATTVDPLLTRLFILLCAAAGCLLVVACANVVNLELAATLVRARLHAVELALGASRSSLLRVALLEGVAGLMAATALGAALAYAATDWVWQNLPARVTTPLVNGVDVDARALGFMAAVATLIWLLTSLPVAIAVARANVLDTLKRDTRTLSVSRSSRLVRQWLTAGQIAVTVVLLTGALLSAQSYAALLAIPKGFDTAGVVAIGIQQKPGDSETAVDLHARLMAHLQARKDAMAVSAVGASPPATAGAIGGPLTIVGRPEPLGAAMLGIYEADPDYFGKTMRLPLLAGREFQPGDPMSAVIVDEAFAARYWPGGDAVGARFRVGTAGWPGAMDGFHIIGVAAHLRTFRDSLSAPSDEFFPVYKQLEDPSLTFAVRLQNERNITDLTSMVRALVPGAIVSVQTVRNRYAALFGNELLAASIMSAFGVFAFLVAMVGIYGVMAFLVAAREREIGIRLAIGASQGAIIRLVLASSARLIIAGVAIGGAAAFAAAQWAGSLLFGVAFDSPWTYTIVAAAVIIAGLLATWQPARKAGRVDPIIALRAE